VATYHGGIPEAVTDGVNGLLVSERDVSGLTDALLTIARHPDRWKLLGMSAAHTIASEFAQPRQVESLESAYFEAIELWKSARLRSRLKWP
jgi:colanic acid/amylovoran biosynthesis glycosyltransferase